MYEEYQQYEGVDIDGQYGIYLEILGTRLYWHGFTRIATFNRSDVQLIKILKDLNQTPDILKWILDSLPVKKCILTVEYHNVIVKQEDPSDIFFAEHDRGYRHHAICIRELNGVIEEACARDPPFTQV